ncbi:filamentous hemagglutinin outer membrane protein [Calothrix sp. NIES-4071]|nr:filamentous hemagglutinin outer membrane protein [Calothrix sp. NIES-4071]BAZ56889.1 filamentous hemagglutinin outer membrane protein [Calothrix sp. NIES-4105]
MQLKWLQYGFAILNVLFLTSKTATAQIVPDATLTTPSTVRLQDNTRFIEGGTRAGNNLFHSFNEFSVPSNSTAFFNNSLDIQNIITRVTGSARSEINGLIKADGIATNLFLINPNGIVFGATGSLDIRGSFVATTANALQFGNLGRFSATNPEAPSPLLTINPSAFLYNQITTAPIQNNSVAAAGLHLANFETYGLRVPDGKSLLLVGGDVIMDGGQLNAFGGRIELTGASAGGNINLITDGSTFSTQVPQSIRSDVFLNNGAIANVAYAKGGSIAVNARNIDLKGSQINAGVERGLGTATAKSGDITLGATQAIKIEQSQVKNQVQPTGIGNAGDINISTGSLSVKEAAKIYTSSLGQGNAGNININAREVSFLNGSFVWTTLEPGGVGKSGDLQIQANSLLVANGSQFKVSTLGKGNSGNLTINARDSVEFDNNAFAFSQVEQGEGNGGIISIDTGVLKLSNNSFLSASTRAKGDAGSVKIQADTVSFAGNSEAFTTVEEGAKGNGNDLLIQARSVSLTDGSVLTASTFGEGKAGNVIIDAKDSVQLDGRSYASSSVGLEGYNVGLGDAGTVKISTGSLFLTNQGKLITNAYGKQGNAGNIIIDARSGVSLSDESYIFSQLGGQIKGKAGNINITTGSLSVGSGSALNADTYGIGDAGNINIQARDNVSFVTEGGAYTRGEFGAIGNGGNINITANSLFINDGSFMATSTLGQGNSGSVTINAANSVNLSGVNKKDFAGGIYSEVATSEPGNGGNINITAKSVSATNGALLATRTNGNGNAGSVNINATDFVLFDGVGSNDRRSGAESLVLPKGIGNANDINITTGSLILRNGADLRAGTEGEGNAGKIKIIARDTVSIDGARSNELNSTIESRVADNAYGNGGDVNITTNSLLVTNGAELTSSSQGNGAAGNLTVDANSIRLDNQGKITADTIAGQGNINLNFKDLLLMRRNSEITTKASGDNVTGGNIKIDSKNGFVVAVKQENSNIRADSQDFRGGNVTINVANIFGFQSQTTSFPEISSITAKGRNPDLGGNVQINTPDTDPSKGLVPLTLDLIDVARLVDDNICARTASSSFTYTGRGGLPVSPNNTLNTDAFWEDWRLSTVGNSQSGKRQSTKLEHNKDLPSNSIIEAQGWVVDKQGEIYLTTYAPTPLQTSLLTSECQS